MSINSLYRTDESREVDGVTINYEDNATGGVLCWFKCRRPGGRNVDFQAAINRKLRKHRQELQGMGDEAQEKLMRKIQAEAYAETVILDWGGDIEGPNGEAPPECTQENIVWLFTEDCPDLFENLQTRLSFRNTWRPEDKEAAAKNSETASGTR